MANASRSIAASQRRRRGLFPVAAFAVAVVLIGAPNFPDRLFQHRAAAIRVEAKPERRADGEPGPLVERAHDPEAEEEDFGVSYGGTESESEEKGPMPGGSEEDGEEDELSVAKEDAQDTAVNSFTSMSDDVKRLKEVSHNFRGSADPAPFLSEVKEIAKSQLKSLQSMKKMHQDHDNQGLALAIKSVIGDSDALVEAGKEMSEMNGLDFPQFTDYSLDISPQDSQLVEFFEPHLEALEEAATYMQDLIKLLDDVDPVILSSASHRRLNLKEDGNLFSREETTDGDVPFEFDSASFEFDSNDDSRGQYIGQVAVFRPTSTSPVTLISRSTSRTQRLRPEEVFPTSSSASKASLMISRSVASKSVRGICNDKVPSQMRQENACLDAKLMMSHATVW